MSIRKEVDPFAPASWAKRSAAERIERSTPPDRVANATSRGRYDGAELRPFDCRPGAMDLMAAPSRIGDRLFYRDGRIEPWP